MTEEEKREYAKRWREEHKEHLKEYAKRYDNEHREQRNAYARKRYAKNREKINSYQREWRKMKAYDATETAYKNGYKKAATEIFDEIEKEIEEALKSNYKALPQVEQFESIWNRVSGKIDALRGIDDFIAELKKKYTEGQK